MSSSTIGCQPMFRRSKSPNPTSFWLETQDLATHCLAVIAPLALIVTGTAVTSGANDSYRPRVITDMGWGMQSFLSCRQSRG